MPAACRVVAQIVLVNRLAHILELCFEFRYQHNRISCVLSMYRRSALLVFRDDSKLGAGSVGVVDTRMTSDDTGEKSVSEKSQSTGV